MAGLLVVDLDHTLVKVDLLVEQVLVAGRTRPMALLGAIRALLRRGGGRAAFKRAIATAADVDVAHLPYRDSVLRFIDAERSGGARVVLASASHRSLVEQVARHLGRFDAVFGTDETNLKGQGKLEAIRRSFPSTPFAYLGDSGADRPLWAASSHAIAVNPGVLLQRWLGRLQVPVSVLRDPVARSWPALRQLRVSRWIRNLLVLLPLVGAHLPAGGALRAALAFLGFSLLSSAGYVLNDLADLQADRRHPDKRHRPLASGDLPVGASLALFVVLLLAAAIPAITLPREFTAALGAFLLVSAAYSIWLKRLLLVDVLALAALHSLRIAAGAAALRVTLSASLLAFAMLLFFGLGLVGRYVAIGRAELLRAEELGAYWRVDHEALFAVGAVCSLLAVPALLVYLVEDAVRQTAAHATLLVLTPPLLMYWISRYLILARSPSGSDDPFAFAIRDKVTWYTLALAVVIVLVSRAPM